MQSAPQMAAAIPYSPGHFTLVRVTFGAFLLWHLVRFLGDSERMMADLPRWLGSSGLTVGFVGALAILAGLLMAGYRRRFVSGLLLLGWVALSYANLHFCNPGSLVIGLLIVVMTLIPDGEPGRWRGREIAPSAWFMPVAVFGGVWFLMAAGYTFIGVAKLTSSGWSEGTGYGHLMIPPLAWLLLAGQILFLPLCLWNRGRLIAWTWMATMHLLIMAMSASVDQRSSLLLLHLFTFDGRWVPGRKRAPGAQPLLLYDGECGLCNAVVRFLLREDREAVLRFAPLQGPTGQEVLHRLGLPVAEFDSLVFLPDEGGTAHMLRTDGATAVLEQLGGIWRLVAVAAHAIPAPLRNLAYKLTARLRYRIFGVYQPRPLPEQSWESRILK